MPHKKRKTAAKKKPFPKWIWAVLAFVVVQAVLIIVLKTNNKAATASSLPLTITASQASAERQQGAFILDVREPGEWVQGHIPGATLIPLGDLSTRLNEAPKDRDVVVVCASGVRSAQGRDILLRAG